MKKYLFLSFIAALILLITFFVYSGGNPGGKSGVRYTLTIRVEGRGTVIPALRSKQTAGTYASLTAIAGNGYYFQAWGGADGGEVKDNTIYMDGDKTLIARFIKIANPPNINIYLTGSIDIESDHPHACFWANGGMTNLCPDKDSIGSAVYASGDHVYIGGCVMDGGYFKACYWVDGNTTPNIIPAGYSSEVKAITYANGTVYVAGQYMDPGNDNFRAFYWASDGGGPVTLDATEPISDASALTVSNGKVYVIGYEGDAGKHKACYWVNGLKQPFPEDVEINSIAVSGGHVYLGGCYINSKDRRRPCYWIDTVRTDLSANSEDEDSWVNAIAVADGHVYTGGCCYGSCYWKDGDQDPVDNYGLEVMAIFVFRGYVFSLGYNIDMDETKIYCYWIDQDTHSKLNQTMKADKITVGKGSNSYCATIAL